MSAPFPRTPITARSRAVAALLLFLAVAGVFGTMLPNPFISLDDGDYVTANRHVLAGLTADGVRWAFTNTDAANWHPLTWLSHMLDVELFGTDPRGHHATSLALHGANAVLVFLLLSLATGTFWRSLFVAAFFALHPLRVESVAWASERKDLLSSLFGLVAIGLYGRYAARPSTARYLALLGAFACSLMSKPMLVTLPLLLLVLDLWPLGRLRAGGAGAVRVVAEKVPLLLLSAAVGLITLLAQEPAMTRIAPLLRITNAARSVGAYLLHMVWPFGLAIIYPYPWPRVDPVQLAASVALLVAATAAAVVWLRRRPWLAAGWAWYLVSLLPVVGLVQVGLQAMADRYTYLPLLGPTVMLTWLAADAVARRPRLLLPAGAAAAAVIVFLSFLTVRQISYWADGETIYRRARAMIPGNWVADFYLGDLLLQRGRPAEALPVFEGASRANPDNPTLLISAGAAYQRLGRREEAIAAYSRAILIDPTSLHAHYNLGLVMLEAGHVDEAIRILREVPGLADRDAGTALLLGNAYLRKGSYGEAAASLGAAVRLDPANAQAHHNLASALAATGRLDDAIAHYRESARLDPKDRDTFNNLGIALARAGRTAEAAEEFRRALALDPSFEDARHNLELATGGGGR